jgi:peptidoglycan/xylan/chitin deacetylase (PgdA/CDA1 family)
MIRNRTRVLVATALAAGAALVASAVPAGAAAQPAGARPAVVRGDAWYLRNTLGSGPADVSFRYGTATDVALMGDWNGDGTATPGVVRGTTWHLRNSASAGAPDLSFGYGRTGDVPVAGDWDGDGIATPGVVRGTTWYLRNSTTGGVADVTFSFGVAGDRPVVGDWNGDGVVTAGVVRGGTTWYLRATNAATSIVSALAYGRPGDVPIAGDWDRTGTETPGVVRGNIWYVRNSTTSGIAHLSFSYGRTGDRPLVWKRVVTTVPAGLRGTEWSVLPTSRRVVALTFDAGANADGVAAILATLQSEGVPGTFFLTGAWVDRFPAEARRIGMRYPVANHSQTHPDFTTLTDAQIRAELDAARTRIASATGQDPRPLFRFPFGARDSRTIGVVNAASYGSIRWTVDTLGWRGTTGGQSVATVTKRVLDTAQPGQIVLMHVGSADDGSTLDADALPGIIRGLRERGYAFTTVRAAT